MKRLRGTLTIFYTVEVSDEMAAEAEEYEDNGLIDLIKDDESCWTDVQLDVDSATPIEEISP